MIKAEELRIGNLIQDLEIEPYYFEVEELRKYVGYSIWAFYRKGSVKAKEVEPIPLTEDWLKRFGFEEAANGFWCPKDLLNVKISKHQIISIYLAGSDTDLAFIGIQYVHQLQNLYFALTQTELTPSDGGKIE